MGGEPIPLLEAFQRGWRTMGQGAESGDGNPILRTNLENGLALDDGVMPGVFEDEDFPLALSKPHRVVAIAGGKGGVGKSTLTVNLAVAVAGMGKTVGIMDADIHGCSIPRMLGLVGQPAVVGETIIPLRAHGVQAISMGSFLADDDPVAWGAPRLTKTVRQFLTNVAWEDLDYLFVDLPPGTGDVVLTLVRAMPEAQFVLVTTPQQAAWRVAGRVAGFAAKNGVAILGVVENMAYFICPSCGEKSEIFGRGGAVYLARQLEVPFLGSVPMAMPVREGGDRGKPVVLENSQLGKVFREIALKIMAGEPDFAG